MKDEYIDICPVRFEKNARNVCCSCGIVHSEGPVTLQFKLDDTTGLLMMEDFFYCNSCGSVCAGLAFFKNFTEARRWARRFIKQVDSGEEIVLRLATKGVLIVRRFNSEDHFLAFAE